MTSSVMMRSTISFVIEDVIWLAGYIDGEGCFTIGFSKGYYSVQATVASTTKSVLEWIQQRFGGNLRWNSGKGKQRPYWHLGWRHNELLAMLPPLIPYLKIKRRQAEILYEFMTAYKRGSHHGKTIPLEHKSGRVRLFQEIRVLNVRGKELIFVG